MFLKNAFALAIVTGMFLAASQPAQAATCNSSGCSGTVARLYTYADGTNKMYVMLDGTVSPANCVLDDGFFLLETLSSTREAAIELLMAAYLSGKTVKLKFVSTTGGSTGICRITVVMSPPI